MQKLDEELSSFQEKLSIEQKVPTLSISNFPKIREEVQNRLYRMIEDFHQKLNEEIHTESRDREFNNEALLKVLEETCNAIDKDVSFKST